MHRHRQNADNAASIRDALAGAGNWTIWRPLMTLVKVSLPTACPKYTSSKFWPEAVIAKSNVVYVSFSTCCPGQAEP